MNDIKKAVAWIMPLLFLCSCASYHQQSTDFYSSFAKGDYQAASKNLDHNKLLKKQRNRLLYLMEKGRTEHLLGNYEASNRLLNAADLMMEDARTTFRDVAAGTLMNPMMQCYQGEDFEKYMVHYYKAMNYLQLGMTEDALVEARRITLRTQVQEDKPGASKHYTDDAFSLMIQGLIYEKSRDYNNAFISYRNAVNVYLANDGIYYGIPMPLQLKKDLVHMAYACGLAGEATYYEDLFLLQQNQEEENSDGELILFWENGLAPVKTEQNLFFSLSKDGSGNFFFADAGGLYHIPFDFSSGYDREKITPGATFRAAMPAYVSQPLLYDRAQVRTHDSLFVPEPAQNINELAFATLEERRIRDLSKTLTRLAIKKLAEAAAKPDTDEKNKNKKNSLTAISAGIQLFALGSEKADTRNWQSLPHSICYTRIPLKKGSNSISFEVIDRYGSSRLIEMKIESQGGMIFRNVSTF